MHSRSRYLSIAIVFLTTKLVASPQTATEKVDVRVVNVDAYVSDRNDLPHLGLSAADFELFEDGVRQPITNFFIVDDTDVRPAPDAASEPAATEFRRRIAVVVDDNYIDKRERDVALQRFEEFVSANRVGGEWSIGVISSRFELIQPFTSDTALIVAALQKVKNIPVVSGNAEISRDILSDDSRRNQSDRGEDYSGAVAFANRAQTYRNARSALSTVKGIVEATRVYGSAAGKKVMFLITGGMELNTTFTAYEKGNADREVSDTKQEVMKLLETAVQEANAANVNIDVIAARTRGSMGSQFDVTNRSAGLAKPTIRGSKGGPPARDSDRPSGSGAHLGAPSQMVMNDPIDTTDVDASGFKIATNTGGLYLTSNVVRDSFVKANTSASHYYSLGFRPNHPEDGKYHVLAVRLKRPGYRVVYRQGYHDIGAEQQLEELLQMRSSALQPAAVIPVSLEAAPAAADGEGLLGFTASMPLKSVTLLDRSGRYEGRVHIYVSVFDRGGKNVGFHHLAQNVVVPAHLREKALSDLFRYTSSLKLPHGEYDIAVTLRDEYSRDIGTAVQRVKL